MVDYSHKTNPDMPLSIIYVVKPRKLVVEELNSFKKRIRIY